MRKALFITHDTGIYGAAKSLELLLTNYREVSVDLIVQKQLFGRNDLDAIRRRFGDRIEKVWEWYLPFDPCYFGRRTHLIFTLLYKIYDLLFWRPRKNRLFALIRRGGYDFIHLNSLVLNPILAPGFPFILHVREIYNGSHGATLPSLRHAKGLIFIDTAMYKPLANSPLPSFVVLNNPFDMTTLSEYASYRPAIPGLDVTTQTIFSMIGVVSEQKGSDFIIDCFRRIESHDARLLIVGGNEAAHIRRCKQRAQGDQRIIFWGAEPDISKVYSISDYIIRGEAFPCIGRTVYEGLYAGCRVIVPGDPLAPPPMFEYEGYRENIFFYRPRNADDLVALLRRRTGSKVGERKLRSNITEYVRAFHAFVISTLTERGGK